MNSFTAALEAASKFHRLAMVAAENGGFWVSAGGGTANVVAGEISRATGVSFEDARRALDITGGEDWYRLMASAQPWRWTDIPDNPRWDARTIAKAACRRAAFNRGTEKPSFWSDKYAYGLQGLW